MDFAIPIRISGILLRDVLTYLLEIVEVSGMDILRLQLTQESGYGALLFT